MWPVSSSRCSGPAWTLDTYLICRAVRAAGFKVALSGLGGAGGRQVHRFRNLKYLPLLRAVDIVPFPVDAVAGRLARVLGVAGEGRPGDCWERTGLVTAWACPSCSESCSPGHW